MSVYFIFVILAAALDVAANLLLEKSDGFKKKKYGISALLLIFLAFTFLAQATKEISLSVAYASWGALGILGTVVFARIFLGQKLNIVGKIGILLVITSVVLLKTA